jgi:hypothetical protein
MRVFGVHETTSPPPGTLAAAGQGDTIIVRYSATRREDWAAIAQAVMTAYVRGASVTLSVGELL